MVVYCCMEVLFKLILLFGAFAGMEFVAWFTHKYVMHGFLWRLHKSHHQKKRGFWEWNDLFFLFFGSLGATFIITGFDGFEWPFWLGSGITLYGLTYITVHDILIHKRLKIFKRLECSYLKALERAHKAHHRNINKQDSESFGLLLVDKKFFK